MSFKFEKTEIEGVIVITPHMYPDDRSYIKSIMKRIYLLKTV